MIGETVGHYEIQERLAEGAMGIVYKARDLHLDRAVAIKFLKPHRSSDEQAMRRFIHEAKAASSLDHPNVCTIYEIETAPNGQMFIAMAYYEGETLRRKLGRGSISIEDALQHTIDIAQGLAKAHRHGLVHRDIKPENVIITTEGVAKILDFGMVKLTQDAAGVRPEAVVGTLGYMAPEQIHGHADHRSDLWSLGIVLYEMLTGRRPFVGRPSEIVEAITHHVIKPVIELREGVSPGIEQLIERALAQNPADRYQRAEELLAHLHALRHGVDSSPATNNARAEGTNSIAVLPFNNVGGDQETEYFSDGLTDELIHLLSQLKGLRVVSHTSAFEFKGKGENIRAIGERLNVNSILGGSVRRAGNRLRITVQLTDAQEGYHLWSQKYDHEVKDVFAIQEDIARSVAGMFEKKVKHGVAPLRSRYVGNVDAHGLYLKGRYHWEQHTEDGFRQAVYCFQQAVATDPSCAPAIAGLADCHISLGYWGVKPPREAWAQGRELALKAREVNPHIPEAEISLAKCALYNNWDWSQAEERALRAIELDPALSTAHVFYGILLIQLGRFESALLELRSARQLDPLSPTVCTGIAWAHYYAGRYDRAVEQCLRAFELAPGYFETLLCMGLINIRQGKFTEAISLLEQTLVNSGNSPFVIGFLGYAYGIDGRVADARNCLDQLLKLTTQRYVSPVPMALTYIGLGEVEEAMNWLDKAYEARDAFLAYAKTFPPYESLRNLPRFQTLLSQLALAGDLEQQTSDVF